MKKVLSIILAAIMLVVMSVGAAAYDNAYINVNCPEGFEESTFFSEDPEDVAAVCLEEYTADENGDEYYTGNYINIWMSENVNDWTVADFNNQEFCDGTAENVIISCNDIDETCEITSKNIQMTRFMETDTTVCTVYYTAKGAAEDGTGYTYDGITTYMVYIYGDYYITICADVVDYNDDAEEVNLEETTDRLLTTAVSSITFKVLSTEESLAEDELETKEALKEMAPMLIIIAVVWLIIIAVYVVVIVLVARSCKKVRKAREKYFAELSRAQQFAVPPSESNENRDFPNNEEQNS